MVSFTEVLNFDEVDFTDSPSSMDCILWQSTLAEGGIWMTGFSNSFRWKDYPFPTACFWSLPNTKGPCLWGYTSGLCSVALTSVSLPSPSPSFDYHSFIVTLSTALLDSTDLFFFQNHCSYSRDSATPCTFYNQLTYGLKTLLGVWLKLH